jgi:type I site-specific restriction endonuclease
MEMNNQKESFEVLELVLKNLAEEQQKVCRMLTENSVMTELISNKLDALMEQVERIKTDATQVNLQPIEDLIRRDIVAREVREWEQPLKIVRQLQILLFPPQDARLFYKVVFSRWLIWLTVMLVITDMYKWGVHYTDVHQQVNLPQLQYQKNTKPVKPENGTPNKIRKRNL